MPKLYIKTYGCQMNVRDSETVASLLQRQGYTLTDSESEADIVIVNTCSVREKAEQKALGKLGLLVASKREHPERLVGAIGCMVQRMQSELLQEIKGLDFAIGPHRLATVPSVITAVQAGRCPILDVSEEKTCSEPNTHLSGSVSAFVNVLFGCDRHCSYCIVPALRGRERSRQAADIIKEVSNLSNNGTKEVTLLGQSIMSYGRKDKVWPENYHSTLNFTEPLPRLLEGIDAIPGIERVRFTSGHPSGCSKELSRAIAELPAVCEHVHLPLQSGSDRILKLMRRGYLTSDFRAVVKRLRAAVPDIAITTDIIVGFPSETEQDFEMTRSFMNEIGFDNAFIFKYSSRPYTKAAKLPDNISEQEKLHRNHILLDDQNRRSLNLQQSLMREDIEVLVEGKSKRNSQRWTGRSRTNKIVVFDKDSEIAPGKLIRVAIERAGLQALYGTVKKP